MKKFAKKSVAAVLVLVMLLGLLSGCNTGETETLDSPAPNALPSTETLGEGDVKWSEEVTPDGWAKVINNGGATLGYSKDSGVTLLQVDGFAFKDLNQNGALDPYEDWRLDVDTRAENLAEQMKGSDQAKLMMFLTMSGVESPMSIGAALTEDIDNGIRTFSVRGSTVEETVQAVNMIQEYAESKPFGIPIDLRGDRGNSLTSQWPTHLGLASTFDVDLVAKYNELYSSELRDLGLTTLHHPQMDMGSEPRWARYTGVFGEHPQMVSDMGVASTNALQSTYDENGNDIGWGEDSTNALIKHFPGDAAGEGGRESHADSGKYNVFPGNNFEMHVGIFEEALNNLPGLTGSAAGVMTNYSISLNGDGTAIGDEAVGTAYSEYKTTELLRNRYNWDGLICTDYSILQDMRSWGMEDESFENRLLKAIEAGNDRIEGVEEYVLEEVLAGFQLYADKYGENALNDRVADSVKRIVRSFIQVGLFENPYLSTAESTANVASADKVEAGYDAMLKSVIMLKNSDNLIHQAEGSEKPTVYIPMRYTAATSRAAASLVPSVDLDLASEYFNVVTDTISETLTGELDENGNPTVSINDVVRASAADVAACDFTLVAISSPANVNLDIASGMFGRPGYDSELDEYLPLSLQYRPYTANSEYVRQESIGGDMVEGDASELYQDDYYGQKGMLVKENRSYYGKSAVISNESDLDLVLYAAEVSDKVIVVVNASNPFVVNEFESEIDSLLIHFGNDMRSILDIVSGEVEPSAMLPMQMPANMETVEAQYEDVPFDMDCHVDSDGNTYDFGFGLNWSGQIHDERNEKYNAADVIASMK